MAQPFDYEPIKEQIEAFDVLVRSKEPNLLSEAELSQVDRTVFRVWCMLNGVYVMPTVELVNFLGKFVDGSTIEIGSGNNFLFKHLGIPGTDSYIQQHPLMLIYYKNLGQAPTAPPPAVEDLAAAEAIEKYRPNTVIAAWVTQKWNKHDNHGSEFGVDEEAIIDSGIRYVFVGNKVVHGEKSILRRPHIEIPGSECGVFSRQVREKDAIYLWNF